MKPQTKEIQFSDIFDKDEIQQIQDLFSDATGVASIITSPDGTAITNPSNFCRLCKLVRTTEIGLANCQKSDKSICPDGLISINNKHFSCQSAGLLDACASIVVDGIHLANWLIGQVRSADLTDQRIIEYASEIGLDKEELRQAFFEVPVVTVEKFQKITDMLHVFANELSTKAYHNLKLHSEVNEREKLNEQLLVNEKYLTQTQEIAHLGTYNFDIVSGLWESSLLLDSIFGIDSTYKRTFDGWLSVVHPDWQSIMLNYFSEEVIKKKNGFDKIYKIVNQSTQKETWVHGYGELFYNHENEPIKMIGTIQDITKVKNAEDDLRESEFKLRSYFDFSPHGVFIANELGQYIETNPAASIITGYSKEELLAVDQKLLIAKESHDCFTKHFEKVKNNGFATDEIEIIRKNKSRGYCKVDTVKLSDCKYLGFVVDITDRKIAENKIKQSELFLLETQLIAQIGNCTIDFNNGKWTSSELLDTILGISPEFNKTNASWVRIIHPDWHAGIINYFQNDVIKNKGVFNKKFKIIRPVDRKVRWLHGIGELKFDNSGNPIKMIGTIQDITERKETAEALRKSEALYRSILNASPDGIVVADITGKISMISQVTLTMFGFANESEVIGRNLFDFFIKEDREKAKLNTKLLFEGTIRTFEYRIKNIDGIVFYAEINGDIIWGKNGHPTGIVYIIRDITERKNTELILSKSQAQLKNFAAHLQTVREEERLILAREIHDELGQILIALKIDLGMTKKNVLKSIDQNNYEKFDADFQNLIGLVDNTINTTRKIMTELRPEVLHLVGFVEATKLYIASFEKRYKIDCEFRNDIANLVLNSQHTIALYRILQEAMSNVALHSEATSVTINFNRESEFIVLEISDNGIGFDVKQNNKPDAYGIIGMNEKAFILDGKFSISSHIGLGTSVKVEMPNLISTYN